MARTMVLVDVPDGGRNTLPAFAAVGIISLFVLLSISGSLILSVR